MSDLRPVQLLCRVGMDIAAWFCMPAVFLFVYVNHYSESADAVLPHVRMMALVLLGLVLVRLLLSFLIPSRALSRFAVSIVTSALLATIFSYYALVLIGLQSWGRVISWDLITSYSSQVLELADALEISATSAIAGFVLAYLGLLGVTWTYFYYFDWAPFVSTTGPKWLLALFLVSGCMVLAIERYSFLAAPWVLDLEPISLTFFPMEAARNLQGHAIDRLSSGNRDRMEESARASYKPMLKAGRRNLILIVVDALRPDHMGVYGYERDTTPNLSRLMNAGMVRKALTVHASCSSSACGLLSLASSKFVHQFSNHPFILHEALKRQGYRVHMVLSGDHTNFYALKRIYGDVDSYYDGMSARRFRYMNDDQLVLDRLGTFPVWDKEPVMIHFHLMATHLLGKRHGITNKYLPAANYALPENQDSATGGRVSERIANYYDNAVLQADLEIHTILEILRGKGYLNDALVVVTADHGESLGEHGVFQHTNSVYEQVLRIPFLLISYGRQHGRPINRRTASQVDIAPTIFAELGMPRPATWVGLPMQNASDGEFSYFQEQSEVGLFDHRDPRNLWKYWINSRTGKEYAFNISLDPEESVSMTGSVVLKNLREWRLKVLPAASVAFDRPTPANGSAIAQ
ncbi:MAG TPA: sulfatase-like hydrolase/transferase [Burkholderiales bacterium]|nr:sulfatase-like hydrolase/transferase [Burkholderiales bacterium]